MTGPLGVIFPPDLPPEQLRDVARAAGETDLPQLWLWEDCFKESGIATAAALLAWTGRTRVGIGLLPVPLRNVALTAMELATLARLFPGRLLPGVGHGVAEWMAQVGARPASPMTLLREYTEALRSLLAGDEVTTSGRYVTLDRVRLDWPPAQPPPVLVGAIGPKTIDLAGAVGDGLILTGETDLDALRAGTARVRAAWQGPGAPEIVCFVPVDGRAPAADVADRIRAALDAGATSTPLLCVGDDPPPLAQFVRSVMSDVAPFLGESVAAGRP